MLYQGEKWGSRGVYVYIGADVVVDGSEIVAVLNMKCVERSRDMKSFMESKKKEEKVVDISEGEPKALLVTSGEVYLCPVSVSTLRKRIGGLFDGEGDE